MIISNGVYHFPDFPSKRSVANHYKTHDLKPTFMLGAAHEDRLCSEGSGSKQCKHCRLAYYPTPHSLSQHIRNQHADLASEERDQKHKAFSDKFWTPQEHALFLTALHNLGPRSNVDIARAIGTKTAKQVNIYKCRLFKKYPDWLSETRIPSADDTT